MVYSAGTWTISNGTFNITVSISTPTTYNIELGLLVGGRIFYDDGSNEATYTFYNSNYNVISTQTISGLANAVWYSIVGTPTKDRWYVYDSTLKNLIQYGKNDTYIGTSDGIGKGKTNTNTALTYTDWEPTSMFTYIQTMRTNKVGGCNDWYIASKAEQEKLRTSGLVAWYDSNYIWSSVETSTIGAYQWGYYDIMWFRDHNKRDTNGCCFGTRSF